MRVCGYVCTCPAQSLTIGFFTLRIEYEIIPTSDFSYEIPRNIYLLICLHDLFAAVFEIEALLQDHTRDYTRDIGYP